MSEPLTLIDMHVAKFADYYANGVLVPSHHYRLVENIDNYARDAGIRVADIYAPFSAIKPTEVETDYVTHLCKTRGKFVEALGMFYNQEMDPLVIDRLRGFAGALLRNHIATKFMTQRRFFDLIIENEDFDEYTVIVLPDIFRHTNGLSDGLCRSTGSVLMERYSEGKHTIVGRIPSWKAIGNKFGEDIVELINSNFMGA